MSDGSTDRDFTTTANRWQRVQDVFAGAIECDGDARARMLDEQCGDDLELRREVESLLASHEQSGPFDRLAPAVTPPRPGPGRRSPDGRDAESANTWSSRSWTPAGWGSSTRRTTNGSDVTSR